MYYYHTGSMTAVFIQLEAQASINFCFRDLWLGPRFNPISIKYWHINLTICCTPLLRKQRVLRDVTTFERSSRPQSIMPIYVLTVASLLILLAWSLHCFSKKNLYDFPVDPMQQWEFQLVMHATIGSNPKPTPQLPKGPNVWIWELASIIIAPLAEPCSLFEVGFYMNKYSIFLRMGNSSVLYSGVGACTEAAVMYVVHAYY